MASTFTPRSIEAYERSMGRWSRKLAGDLIAFGGLAEGERVLDVGCGTGSLLFRLAEPERGLAAIDGIDFTPGFVEYVASQTSDPRITVQQGDACELPFGDGVYDRAFCQLVLHFVTDPAQAVAEMRRVVRPGGMITAATWDHYGGNVVHRMLLDTAAVLDAGAEKHRAELHHKSASRPGGLSALFREAGLQEVSETSIVVRMEFRNFAEYWLPIVAGEGRTGQYVATLEAEKRAVLEEHVRRAYLCSGEDGPRSFASVALACRGRVA